MSLHSNSYYVIECTRLSQLFMYLKNEFKLYYAWYIIKVQEINLTLNIKISINQNIYTLIYLYMYINLTYNSIIKKTWALYWHIKHNILGVKMALHERSIISHEHDS